MELILRGKGMWSIVLGEERAPPSTANPTVSYVDALAKLPSRRDIKVTNQLSLL